MDRRPGRPPLPPAARKEWNVTIRLSEQEHERVQALAHEAGFDGDISKLTRALYDRAARPKRGTWGR